MPPKDKKKKAKKKAPAFQTGAADLAPWGVQAGQLVRNSLGCSGTVIGAKVSPAGSELWVRWVGGLDAPVDAACRVRLAGSVEQLQMDIVCRRQEQAAMDAKWKAYEEGQARKQAEAAKAAAKKKKKAMTADAEAEGGALPEGGAAGAAAAAEAAGEAQ